MKHATRVQGYVTGYQYILQLMVFQARGHTSLNIPYKRQQIKVFWRHLFMLTFKGAVILQDLVKITDPYPTQLYMYTSRL